MVQSGVFRAATLLMLPMAAAAVLLASPAPARADQFILFDATFTYTKSDADNATPNKSHYYVNNSNPTNKPNPNRPTNWTAPIDYRNGIVHIRTEVIEKPAGSELTQWWLCYIANRGVPGTGGYGCTTTGTYKEQGVYDREESMTTWWDNTAIDWTAGIKQIDLIMKDYGTGNGGNYTHLRPDPEHFFPTRMRITAIQVSKGGTYDPSMVPNVPARPPGDGGAPDAAAPVDAASETPPPSPGTGGASGGGTGGSGSGGADGSGGSVSATGGSSGGTGSGGQGPVTGATAGGGCAVSAGQSPPSSRSSLVLTAALAMTVAALVRRRRRRR